MRLAVMQPYFLPYIGYFMLIGAVDRFVIFDDAQYIARGWINRNRLLLGGRAHPFVLPVRKAGRDTPIHAMELALDNVTRRSLLELFRHAYAKAPYYGPARALLEDVLNCGETRLEPFLTRSLRLVCDYMGLATPFTRSSDLELGVTGKDKIIPLCRHFTARRYVNAIGGVDLYDAGRFAEHGLELRFLRADQVRYAQFGGDFVPNLSIIDVLMFNSPEDCRAMLAHCALEEPRTVEEGA